MKKTIWKRISESQLRKKNKFWSFVAKGKILICVGSSIIPRDWSEISLGDNFKKLNYHKGLNALWKEMSLIMYDPLIFRPLFDAIIYHFFTVSYCIIPSVYRMLSENLINRHQKLQYRLISDIADYCIVNNTLEPSIEYIL